MTFADAHEILLPKHRSKWLRRAIEILRWDFHEIGETIPERINVHAEFPHQVDVNWQGTYRKVVYKSEHIATYRAIFICPMEEGLDALDILVHELVHAATDTFDHGEKFLVTAAAIGLDDTGPSAAAQTDLLCRLQDIEEHLGRYPMYEDLIGGPA
jgi:hypothetical protein